VTPQQTTKCRLENSMNLTRTNVFLFFAGLMGFFLSPADCEASKAKRIPKKPGIVRFVGESPKGPFAVVDYGKQSGYEKGLEICFFTPDGEKTGCGVVEEATPRAAGVRFKVGETISVTPGQRAWAGSWGPLPAMEGYSDNADLAEEESEDLKETMIEEPSLLKRVATFELSPYFRLPLSHNGFSFDPAIKTSGQGSVWKKEPAKTLGLLSFDAAFRSPSPGARDRVYRLGYTFVPQIRTSADFSLGSSDPSVQSWVVAHHYRAGVQWGFGFLTSPSFDLLVSGGGELWLSQYKFGADASEGTTLAQGSMVVPTLMAPIDVQARMIGKTWMFQSGIKLALPLWSGSPRVSGVSNLGALTTAAHDVTDIRDAIEVKKTLGVALTIGVGRLL
jgi:hypothetical protein